MVKRTLNRIRNERWLQDARFLNKHMDLYLIDLLEKKQISVVLDCIKKPRKYYHTMLYRLVAEKVPNVDEEWINFINRLKQAIQNAALATMNVDKNRAQTFVSELRNEFLKGYLQSEHLASAFLVDYSGEYEDCDSEGKTEFQEICVSNLIQMLKDQVSLNNQQDFAKELGPEVVEYMKSLNDPATVPRCDAMCPMCKSFCIEAANHDPGLRPHNAIHQPKGIAGVYVLPTKELVADTCSQSFACNGTFCKKVTDGTVHKYRDFAKVFPGWNNPRINEELPLREYILATYNRDIARIYNVKPCPDIPARYFRVLTTIKEQLKREIECPTDEIEPILLD
jgi:hypothetical protein